MRLALLVLLLGCGYQPAEKPVSEAPVEVADVPDVPPPDPRLIAEAASKAEVTGRPDQAYYLYRIAEMYAQTRGQQECYRRAQDAILALHGPQEYPWDWR